MRTRLLFLAITAVGWVFCAATRHAAAQESFYQGKSIRLIVGSDPGGGFDTYSRTIARHMSKYIPGKPAIVVENMPGAAQMISANYLYKLAKPDGLTMGNFAGTLFLAQVMGRQGVEYDVRKFEYLGAPARDFSSCTLSKRTGMNSLQQWLSAKSPVKIGGIGPGDFTYEIPKILEFALGLPIQVVAGYKGTAPIRLAVESGEVDGVCMDWNSVKATWRNALDTGEVKVVVQIAPRAHPELGDLPLAMDFAKSAEGRKLIQVGIHDRGLSFRPYTLPPGVSRERSRILRTAFVETLSDPEFLADAKKANLVIEAVPSSEIDRVVTDLFKLEPAIAAKLAEVMK